MQQEPGTWLVPQTDERIVIGFLIHCSETFLGARPGSDSISGPMCSVSRVFFAVAGELVRVPCLILCSVRPDTQCRALARELRRQRKCAASPEPSAVFMVDGRLYGLVAFHRSPLVCAQQSCPWALSPNDCFAFLVHLYSSLGPMRQPGCCDDGRCCCRCFAAGIQRSIAVMPHILHS